ncbi:MAG: hypothetical protein OHK0053_13620 [Microscillaceae bacterium]
MKTSEIKIKITLDEAKIPEKIEWEADDLNEVQTLEAKAMSLSFWDAREPGTLKIDLWNKEMEVPEMKRFIIEVLTGLADMARRATDDEIMAMDIDHLCQSLSRRLEQEFKNAGG